MTWQKLLAIEIGIALAVGCSYLTVTSHWLLWGLLMTGFLSGAAVSALEASHRRHA